MTSNIIKTIIFDFGNVVAHLDYGRAYRRISPFTDMSEEQIRAAIAGSDFQLPYESGWMTNRDFILRLRELCRLTCDEEVITSAWSDIFVANEKVCRLIAQLRSHYRLLLGSNTNDLHARQFRRQFADTLQHFDELVLSYEVGTCKPDVLFYQTCQQRALCSPEQCVFIDDLRENVDEAKRSRMKGIVYTGIESLTVELRELGIDVLTIS